MSEKLKLIKVCVFAPGLIPSVTIGVLRPLIKLKENEEIELRIRPFSTSFFSEADIQWCDVAVFCRNTEPTELKFLYRLKSQGKRIIYEIDDNFEEIPLTTNIGVYHRNINRLHVLRRFFSLSDIVRVYSPIMQLRAENHGGNVSLERSYFDFNLVEREPIPVKSSLIKIGYPIGRLDDLRVENLIFEVLNEILTKYVGRVQLYLWRKDIPIQLRGLKGIVLNKYQGRYEQFIKYFYSLGLDIGLAPLIDEPFFHSKTNNKYREYGGCGIAGVYSDMPPYNNSIESEKNGILVKNTVRDWVEAISLLIDDPIFRQKITNEAKKDVLETYSFDSAVNSYRRSLQAVISRESKPCLWLKKELFDKRYYVRVALLDNCRQSHLTCYDYFRPLQQQLEILFEGIYCYFHTATDLVSSLKDNNGYDIIFCAIRSAVDVTALDYFVKLSNNIVLDVSPFADDCKFFKFLFENRLLTNTITIILGASQTDLLNLAKKNGISTFIVKENINELDEMFSLSGRSATYLDLFEKNIFNTRFRHRKRNRSIKYFQSLKRKYEKTVNRLQKIWIFIRFLSCKNRFL